MRLSGKLSLITLLIVASSVAARADAVTDWNVKACEIVTEAGISTPPANRVMAIMHTAVYDAVNAITKRYPANGSALPAAPDASVESATFKQQ